MKTPGRRNAVLAEVDARASQDAVTQARATLAGAEAASQNAALTADRTRRLLEHGIAARQELDDAEARLASACARHHRPRLAREHPARAPSWPSPVAPSRWRPSCSRGSWPRRCRRRR